MNPEQTLEIIQRIYADLNIRPQDWACLIPEETRRDAPEERDQWPMSARLALDIQLNYAINRQLHYIRGFDLVGNFMIPPGYEFLSKECERFFRDHPRYEDNVFLMTRFDPANKFLATLDATIRQTLRGKDLNPVRADDKMYMPDRNLWNNVCVYMLCCGKGVAILEDRAADEFNPNVALEYGFMRALNRPTLLLADKGFRNLRADIIGTLREQFDLLDIENTVPEALERWLAGLT
ncbi:hypothetical protein GCM10007977_089340 [Dactylosporangium sucinum]|uniref:Uncharacterized protein n=1 Tax=Dactylosporangium sucinum TaxID=1424081 RepID=A0A917UCF7_9ACTN|nr:hypothetical protein GCM10007977_089340 [Dactylosporangium sucinum]